VPQFARLVCVSTHAPPQQVSLVPQACPHAPQLPWLVCVSVQAPEQFDWPDAQQIPLWHDGVPPLHCFVHVPQ
jgi:hypothetical protein